MSDEGLSWRLLGRAPMTAMEEAYTRLNAAATARSFATCASPIAMSERKVIDGWLYLSTPEPPPDLEQRQANHRARIQRWLEEGTSIYEAEMRTPLEEGLAAVRSLPAEGGPSHAARIRASMELAALAHGELHWWMVDSQPFDWPATYRELTGRPAEEANVLLRGLDSAGTELVHALTVAGRALQTDGEESPVFRAALAALLDRFGTRSGTGYGSMVGFGDPTWELDPERAMTVVRAYARADLATREGGEREARTARQALLDEVRAELQSDEAKGADFERALWRAQANVLSQENSNDLIEQQIIGTMKRVIVEAGRWAVACGRLDDVDGVWHLDPDDLAAETDLRAVVAARRSEHARRTGERPPSVLRDDGTIAEGSGGRPPRRSEAPPEGGLLRGEGIYPGVVTGPARVVPRSMDPPDLDDGEILVTADTGPAWTPVFPLLAAVVLDGGSAFQHAAIMAREYGIPCVIGTRHATRVIADGATITVDGAAGTVTVHETSSAALPHRVGRLSPSPGSGTS